MIRSSALAASLVLLTLPALHAGEKKLESGCKAGEGVPTFTVKDVTGPNKGRSLCYV